MRHNQRAGSAKVAVKIIRFFAKVGILSVQRRALTALKIKNSRPRRYAMELKS